MENQSTTDAALIQTHPRPGTTVRTPDMAVSHMINGLADVTDPGCVLHVCDVRCPLGWGIGGVGADVFLRGELGAGESGES